MIREVVVHSLGDLIAHTTPPEPDPATGRRRSTGVYRGAADAAWPLLTSLDTLGGADPPHTKAELEEHVLRNFIRYSRPYFATPPVNDWEVLVAAQHHGLPTRLLDWTYSPLVAAHFATVDPGTSDRAVWRLDWKAVHRRFQLPDLALLIQDLEVMFGYLPELRVLWRFSQEIYKVWQTEQSRKVARWRMLEAGWMGYTVIQGRSSRA